MSSDLRDRIDEIAPDVRNWGRWGADDERGTLNLITPEARRAAAACVRKGVQFSLSIPLDEHGPARPGGIRENPRHEMTAVGDGSLPGGTLPLGAGFCDDAMHLYLQCATQWDSLAHVHYDGYYYNGFPAESVTLEGAEHVAITAAADEFVARGVLLNVARARGVAWLPPGEGIDGDELDAVAAAQGVEIHPGDILLIRTGLMRSWHETGNWDVFRGPQPGLDYTIARWLHRHDIAAVAADNTAVECLLAAMSVPLHMLALRDMGMCFGELWDLEGLADDCAADGVYECLLVAPALHVTGGVGSPVNPIAIK